MDVNTIQFPNFPGLEEREFILNRTAFSIFGIEVQWYGIIIAFGFLLALLYAGKICKKLGLDIDRVIDVAIGGLVGGIIGARLYYVIFSWDQFAGDWSAIFRIWDGGLAIYGGIIAGVLVGSLIARWRKVKLLPMFDMAGLGFLIGQAIGRWGNFVNVEAFGGNTSLPWGMTSPKISFYLESHLEELEKLGMNIDPNMPVHPTFLYESLWCAVGFVLLHCYLKHRKFDGEISLMYLAWYGFGRYIIEGLRTDSLIIVLNQDSHPIRIRVSQMLALVCVIVAVTTWVVVRVKIRKRRDAGYLPLYVNTEESRELLRQAAKQRQAEKEKRRQKKEAKLNGGQNPAEEEDVQGGESTLGLEPEEPEDHLEEISEDEKQLGKDDDNHGEND